MTAAQLSNVPTTSIGKYLYYQTHPHSSADESDESDDEPDHPDDNEHVDSGKHCDDNPDPDHVFNPDDDHQPRIRRIYDHNYDEYSHWYYYTGPRVRDIATYTEKQIETAQYPMYQYFSRQRNIPDLYPCEKHFLSTK